MNFVAPLKHENNPRRPAESVLTPKPTGTFSAFAVASCSKLPRSLSPARCRALVGLLLHSRSFSSRSLATLPRRVGKPDIRTVLFHSPQDNSASRRVASELLNLERDGRPLPGPTQPSFCREKKQNQRSNPITTTS